MAALDEAVRQLGLVEVFDADRGSGYDWADFKAWKAPDGRFYWYGESGCSCTTFGDDFTSMADFGDGDRSALESAFRIWVDEHSRYYYTAQEIIEGLEKLRRL